MYRESLIVSLSVVELLPGIAYLFLFLFGILGRIDPVGLCWDVLPAWSAPLVIATLSSSAIGGVVGSTSGHSWSPWVCRCGAVAVVLLVVDVPLVLAQLVTMASYND